MSTSDAIGPGTWQEFAAAAQRVSLEAAKVVRLRALRIAAGGPAAIDETMLMVAEKFETALGLQSDLLLGRLGRSPLGMATSSLSAVAATVEENRRRLVGLRLARPSGSSTSTDH